jgi:hypothetical protein
VNAYLIWSPNGLWLVTPTWTGGRSMSSYCGIMSLDRARLMGAELGLTVFIVGQPAQVAEEVATR